MLIMRQTSTFYPYLFYFVTMFTPYNVDMNILTVFPIKGLLFTLLLFTVCLLGVHTILLARIGWKTQRKNPDEAPKPEEKKPPVEREPIYYIVERKTKRAKASYGEPKQINFKP